MDNYFVLNFMFGLFVVEVLVKVSFVFVDMYLMIVDFDWWVLGYVEVGV